MCDTACHTGGHRNGLVWEILFNISQLVAIEPRAVAWLFAGADDSWVYHLCRC